MNMKRQRYAVVTRGKETQLTPQEHQLLHYLMRNRNSAVSTRQLTEQALGMSYDPASRQVEALVFKLRKKMGHTVIKDHPGYGFQIEEPAVVA